MPRSHPPTALTLVRRTLREEAELPSGAGILLGVSGGADSMVLLHILAKLRVELKFCLHAHGVDHGLRPEATRELDIAETFAEHLGVPFARSRVELSAAGNLQARARSARYAALRTAAAEVGAGWIATAHHANDRAETVLLRLLRGTSVRGLGVLPAQAGDLLRPLIRARKQDVEAHAARHHLPFVQDPSNRDSRFLRVRVRSELMPVLEDLSPGIVASLNAIADEVLAERRRGDLPAEALAAELGRAQRQELERMLKHPSQRARLRLSGGRELMVNPANGLISIKE